MQLNAVVFRQRIPAGFIRTRRKRVNAEETTENWPWSFILLAGGLLITEIAFVSWKTRSVQVEARVCHVDEESAERRERATYGDTYMRVMAHVRLERVRQRAGNSRTKPHQGGSILFYARSCFPLYSILENPLNERNSLSFIAPRFSAIVSLEISTLFRSTQILRGDRSPPIRLSKIFPLLFSVSLTRFRMFREIARSFSQADPRFPVEYRIPRGFFPRFHSPHDPFRATFHPATRSITKGDELVPACFIVQFILWSRYRFLIRFLQFSSIRLAFRPESRKSNERRSNGSIARVRSFKRDPDVAGASNGLIFVPFSRWNRIVEIVFSPFLLILSRFFSHFLFSFLARAAFNWLPT